MPNISLKNLTDRQRTAWKMRYRYGWYTREIALHLGITQPAVTRLLQRAHRSAGLPVLTHFTVKQPKGPRVRAMSLSDVFNY